MRAVASTLTHTQLPLDYTPGVGRVATSGAAERAAHLRSGDGPALTRVDPEDLARFEGEGGLEAPEP